MHTQIHTYTHTYSQTHYYYWAGERGERGESGSEGGSYSSGMLVRIIVGAVMWKNGGFHDMAVAAAIAAAAAVVKS